MNNFNKDKQKQYRRKCKYIKKFIKSLILANAALCDEVARHQESIAIVKEERRFLLQKLIEYENCQEHVMFHFKNKKNH